MADAREYFGGSFLTLKDVEEGPIQATIDKVEEGKFGKLNAVFEDGSALELNATNTRTLARAFGPNTDRWCGHTIEMFEGETTYQGKTQPTVLVKAISKPVAHAMYQRLPPPTTCRTIYLSEIPK